MNDVIASIPLLQTERLLLRGYEEQDLPAYMTIRGHPDVYRYTTGRPMTEEEAWNRIAAARGHWTLRHYGLWAIEEKATGAFIGSMGFVDARRDSFISRRDLPEAGWWLAAEKHGKGYATEALRAIHHWGDRNLVARCTFCGIMAANKLSLRLAQSMGYELKEEAIYLGHPSLVFERPLPAIA